MVTNEALSRRYDRILVQLKGLLENSPNMTARLATTAALLHHKMPHFFWTGFYLMKRGELTVGPYQGPLACQVLAKNEGVCWAACREKRTLIVPDVHAFPGHIACDSRSKSEIVVPMIGRPDAEVLGVLDVDGLETGAFGEPDRKGLEKIVDLLLEESRRPFD